MIKLGAQVRKAQGLVVVRLAGESRCRYRTRLTSSSTQTNLVGILSPSPYSAIPAQWKPSFSVRFFLHALRNGEVFINVSLPPILFRPQTPSVFMKTCRCRAGRSVQRKIGRLYNLIMPSIRSAWYWKITMPKKWWIKYNNTRALTSFSNVKDSAVAARTNFGQSSNIQIDVIVD